MEERIAAGQSCMLHLDLKMPALVDEMDDGVATAYNAVPERLYLVGVDGKIVYKGGIGPIDFKPQQWRRSIEEYVARLEAA